MHLVRGLLKEEEEEEEEEEGLFKANAGVPINNTLSPRISLAGA